jgi:hypothetical protein
MLNEYEFRSCSCAPKRADAFKIEWISFYRLLAFEQSCLFYNNLNQHIRSYILECHGKQQNNPITCGMFDLLIFIYFYSQ